MDFTLSNARRFYSSKGDPLVVKGLKNHPYLGVMLSSELRWISHVENIVVKANKSLGFVRHNLYPGSERTKRSAYITIVRPNVIHTNKNRLIQLKQSSGVQLDLSKETITEVLTVIRFRSSRG